MVPRTHKPATRMTNSPVRIAFTSLFGRLLPIFSPRKLFNILRALEFQNLRVLLHAAIERHADLPGPSVNVGIIECGFVGDVSCVRQRIPFDHMQGRAMEISGSVKPAPDRRLTLSKRGRINERRVVDDERIALPMAVRPSHPRLDGSLNSFAHVNDAPGIRVLVSEHDLVLTLDDLKWIRQIRRTRDAR